MDFPVLVALAASTVQMVFPAFLDTQDFLELVGLADGLGLVALEYQVTLDTVVFLEPADLVEHQQMLFMIYLLRQLRKQHLLHPLLMYQEK